MRQRPGTTHAVARPNPLPGVFAAGSAGVPQDSRAVDRAGALDARSRCCGGPVAAATLRGVGMDVNLAPVLDVSRQARDFDDQH